MAKRQRDIRRYTPFGLQIHDLCVQQKLSFRALARESGMSPNSQMAIIRACRGEITPQRDTLLGWCRVLQADTAQRSWLLHYWHYTTPEEEGHIHAGERQPDHSKQ